MTAVTILNGLVSNTTATINVLLELYIKHQLARKITLCSDVLCLVAINTLSVVFTKLY